MCLPEGYNFKSLCSLRNPFLHAILVYINKNQDFFITYSTHVQFQDFSGPVETLI